MDDHSWSLSCVVVRRVRFELRNKDNVGGDRQYRRKAWAYVPCDQLVDQVYAWSRLSAGRVKNSLSVSDDCLEVYSGQEILKSYPTSIF